MLTGFHVTYEITTDASAEQGDNEESGFIGKESYGNVIDRYDIESFMKLPKEEREPLISLTFREAISLIEKHGGYIENDGSYTSFLSINDEWIYSDEYGEEKEDVNAHGEPTGDFIGGRYQETRTIHLPEWVTPSSRKRIARYLGAK